jgi:cytochrome c peroxidase
MVQLWRLGVGVLVLSCGGAKPEPMPPFVCDTLRGLTQAQCQTVKTMRLGASPPPAVGNAVADDPRAARLGFNIFFDRRFSSNGTVRCANCHVPEKQFGDARGQALGLELTDRNSPSTWAAAWHRWQNWDGRADSLWSQPLLALENPKEMDFTRLEVAHRVGRSYRTEYETIFGALPALEDTARFPARGKPGLPEWESMRAEDRQAIDRVAANVGKSLEAFMRKSTYGPGAFDAFLDGDQSALTQSQQVGLVVFFIAKCDTCHSGPNFSDDKFYNLGVEPLPGSAPTAGRAEALAALNASPFNRFGPHFDGQAPTDRVSPLPTDEGAFRTPTLRNVANTGPWGHNGRFDTLESVIDFHLQGGGTSAGRPTDSRLPTASLSAAERAALIDFVSAITAARPPSPWDTWPDR